MRIRAYILQHKEHPFVAEIMRLRTNYRGQPIMTVENRTVFWHEHFRAPVLRFESSVPDDGYKFLRDLAGPDMPPCIVKIRDLLPVVALYEGPKEGVYGRSSQVRGRVTALMIKDAPYAQLQVRAASPGLALNRYGELRTNSAKRTGKWRENWWPDNLAIQGWV